MKVAFLMAIFAGVCNVNANVDTRATGMKHGVNHVQKRQSIDDDGDDKTTKWIGVPFYPNCNNYCNFLQYCLSDELDPDNRLYPHCKGYPMLEIPSEDCLKCMIKNGFVMPEGITPKTAKGKCICRRVQSVITIAQADTCPMDENQKPLCDLDDPKAEVSTTDESECSCGKDAPTGDKPADSAEDDAERSEENEPDDDRAEEPEGDATEKPTDDAERSEENAPDDDRAEEPEGNAAEKPTDDAVEEPPPK